MSPFSRFSVQWSLGNRRRCSGFTAGTTGYRRERGLEALTAVARRNGGSAETARSMRVLFTLNCSFYPSTSSSTISVRAYFSILERRNELCGHKTTPQRYCVATYPISTGDNAMYLILLGYDRRGIHIL